MVCEYQAPLSSAISQSLLKFMFLESVMLPNHLILSHPFSFCLQSFPALGSSSESAPRIRWPKCWSFSFIISPSSEWSYFNLKKEKKGAGECGIDKTKLGHVSSDWNARHQPFCIAKILQTLSAARREHLIIFSNRAGECVLTQACSLTLPMDGQLDQLWTNVHTEVEQIWKG